MGNSNSSDEGNISQNVDAVLYYFGGRGKGST